MNGGTVGGLARGGDPDTAKAAAAAAPVTKLEAAVLDALRDAARRGRPGLTAEETAAVTGLDKQSVTPRFRALADKGLARDTGQRAKNRSGRSAIVWSAAPAAPTQRAFNWQAQ